MKSVEVHDARILLADDGKANIEQIDNLLKKAGFTQVLKESDWKKILESHRRKPFDLILLDIDKIGDRGFQMMKSLRNIASDPYLCAIVISNDSGLKLHALKAGAKGFLSKPFEAEELIASVNNLLEVRLLYRALEINIEDITLQFEERTSELQVSEARFRGFTDLASDWYWEQDPVGNFTKVSGPVPEILGIEVDSSAESTNNLLGTGWNANEQSILRAKITAREPFLDFEFSRSTLEGGQQTFLVSGQPMFDSKCIFLGYRGIGVEISAMKKH